MLRRTCLWAKNVPGAVTCEEVLDGYRKGTTRCGEWREIAERHQVEVLSSGLNSGNQGARHVAKRQHSGDRRYDSSDRAMRRDLESCLRDIIRDRGLHRAN